MAVKHSIKRGRVRHKLLGLYVSMSVMFSLVGCGELPADQRTPVIMKFATEIVDLARIQVLDRDGKYLDVVNDPYVFDTKAKEVFIDRKSVGVFPDSNEDEDKLLGGALPSTLSIDGEEQAFNSYNYTQLKDGRYFICGGVVVATGKKINCTWIFDPASKRLQRGPNLIVARDWHLVTLLKDGRVFISGGETSYDRTPSLARVNCSYSGHVRELELYDPKTNTISKVCNLNKPRYWHRTIELNNGKVLIISGETDKEIHDAGVSLTSTVELVDIEQKTSTVVGQLHHARRSFDVFPMGNGVLILGGEMDGYFDVPGDSSVIPVELYKY